ncbi:TPR-like protein [Dioscorea alata]|uniref:TPR-like protein n=1 Tax=Dioscorea alata TaxID=55571 RepID=A0ACB7WB78_DIOAL|nr:TPR-like protein [Dioscorea alata]
MLPSIVAVGTIPLPPNSNCASLQRRRNTSPSSSQHHTITLLRRCKTIQELHQIHAKILKTGHSQDPHLLFKLLHHCSTLNSIDYAFKLFETIQAPDVYHYTALICGSIVSGHSDACFRLFFRLLEGQIMPDLVVISYVLKACGIELSMEEGRQVHGHALKLGVGNERLVSMRLIEFYGKCGVFGDAEKVFDGMPQRDAVATTILISCYSDWSFIEKARTLFDNVGDKDTACWTAMINGLVENGMTSAALELFREMQGEKVPPNEVTVVCVLSACSQLGALELGRWIHSYVGRFGIKRNTYVGSTLVDMYSKCGSLEEAKKVFDEMPNKDVVSYNSMIAGLALNGRSREAAELFKQMIDRGLSPNHITFVGVLNACSHGGLVELGYEIFESMTKVFSVEPRIEHYGCMVDLLGRVGRLDEAYEFIGRMRIQPDHVIWGTLLNACKMHRNLDLAEKVAEILMKSDAADSGTYVLLSNVYASFGKWSEAVGIRSKMKDHGIQKEPGCSSIEVDNEVHEFLLGDIEHPRRDEIYQKLEELSDALKLEGYSPEKQVVLQDIEEDEKEWALSIHSERLAICYGLISTKPMATIRVVNNLRVCNDCHSLIKFISKITGRRIVLRDRNRFHHFEDGFCSCGDYW